MADRVKLYLDKLLDIWKKYSSKQKTLIISAVSIVVLALALLVILMRRTEYKHLTIAATPADASKIVSILKDADIKYKVAGDNLSISVDAQHQTDAVFLLAENDMPSTGLTVDDLLNNSLSVTNYDRTLKVNLYFQNQLRKSIINMEGIDDAEIYYLPSESYNSILTEVKDTSASVILKVNDKFKTKTAQTIAEVVASLIGNKNADLIKVADQYGNLLYGGEADLYSGSPSSKEDYKEKLRNTYINNLYTGLIKSGFDDAVIMPNLTFNMDKVTELYTEYTPAQGQEQGLYGHSYTYSSENSGSSGGVPGTDSNDETSYQMPDRSNNSGSVDIEEYDYLPNVKEVNTIYEVGAVIPEQSSISIVLRRAVTYKEENLELEGALSDMTFDEYAARNGNIRPVEVDPSLLTLVSKATGIAESDIFITAFEQPVFIPKAVKIRSWTDYLQIILAVLIVAMLVFVVFKGVSPVEVTELEPELSVEQLLASTKESQSLEEIDFEQVSEIRRVVEKFVDEKPEAVAQLLRNWLNEDWN